MEEIKSYIVCDGIAHIKTHRDNKYEIDLHNVYALKESKREINLIDYVFLFSAIMLFFLLLLADFYMPGEKGLPVLSAIIFLIYWLYLKKFAYKKSVIFYVENKKNIIL